MDTKAKVIELANSKNMTLEEFHVWVLNQPYVTNCCRMCETTKKMKCLGNEMTIDSLTFKVSGHCYSLKLHAKQEGEEYVLINELCDH